MRLAEIDANGIVANVIEVDLSAVPDWATGFVDIGDIGGPGWHWDGQAFSPPPDPGPDRSGMSLTRRQLMIGLREAGLISQAEARAPRHTPPAAIDAMFAQLPEPEQTRAYITWAEFIEAQRLDPLVAMIAAVAPVPMDDAAIDAFFLTYATL